MKNELIKPELIVNKTEFFHDIFGRGVLKDVVNEFIYIQFDNQRGLKCFSYPESNGKDIFLNKTKKIREREKHLKDPEYKRDYDDEKEHYENISILARKNFEEAKLEVDSCKYGFNDNADSYNPDIGNLYSSIYKHKKQCLDIYQHPYFARIDYGVDEKKYIGKHEIPGEVIDWREKEITKLYYQFNNYIGKSNYNISLVRDFEIIATAFCDFSDKYNNQRGKVISDGFLLDLIQRNRENKRIHDIIESIRKNQHEIISSNSSRNSLISGCAGSGKTMILLHRLSYLLFNEINLNREDIYVISPTSLLNMEVDELSLQLELNTIKRKTTNSFYFDLLKEYFDDDNRLQKKGKSISNNYVENQLIDEIYSLSFIETYKANLRDIKSHKGNCYSEFVDFENKRLITDYTKFLGKSNKINNIASDDIENTLQNRLFIKACKIIEAIPRDNAIEKIKSVHEQISQRKQVSEPEKHEKEIVKFEKQIEILSYSVKHCEMNADTLYNNDGTTSIGSGRLYKELFDYFEINNKKNQLYKEFLKSNNNFSSIIEFFVEYKMIDTNIRNFKNFLNAYDTANYILEILSYSVEKTKLKLKIPISETFDLEVFLYLIGCTVLIGPLSDKKILLFVDEFQDYSSTEIEMFRRIFPNGVLNLFGDIRQRIKTKGISIDNLRKISDDGWKCFKINENYRNAKQITEYVNNVLDLNMTPIGIDGILTECSIDEIESITIGSDDRVALIIKDIQLYEEVINIVNIDDNLINVIQNDDSMTVRGKLNIIPVELSKGLEFEEVYVIPSGMSDNEKYISYTRALSKLFIIDYEYLAADTNPVTDNRVITDSINAEKLSLLRAELVKQNTIIADLESEIEQLQNDNMNEQEEHDIQIIEKDVKISNLEKDLEFANSTLKNKESKVKSLSDTSYTFREDAKILMLGGDGGIKDKDITGIFKSLGFSDSSYEHIQFDDVKGFDINKCINSLNYSDIFIGVTPHKAKGMGDSSSLMQYLKDNEDDFPRITEFCDDDGTPVKFTKTKLKQEIKNSALYSSVNGL